MKLRFRWVAAAGVCVLLVLFSVPRRVRAPGGEALPFFEAPAGERPARIDPGGETVLPNGRVITPRGRQFFTAPHPYGLALSPDRKTLYLNDSWSAFLWKFDVKSDGSLTNRRRFADLALSESRRSAEKKTTNADGMAVDSSGHLYVATDLGIQVYSPAGQRLGVISFPTVPSNCKFGGGDLKTLYVTGGKRLYSVQTMQRGMEYPLR
jgi:gluconolactonase